MRDQPPPRATALLKRFGPENDALAGDLREAYIAGKPGWWYWGQVLAAVARTNDRVLMARRVLVGWVAALPLLLLLGGSLAKPRPLMSGRTV